MQIHHLISKMHTMIRLLKKPKRLFYPMAQNGFFKWMPDKQFLKILYWSELDRKLDIKKPVLFSEKIQWLKLYDRKPEYTTLVDKYLVKKTVADKIGQEFIIPTLGVWNSADEIEFEKLPEKFILKCTHDSGGIVLCENIKLFDKEKAIRKLTLHMRRDPYTPGREWPYKNVVPRIIAEQLLIDPDHKDLIDYKFYCFNGKPVYCQVIQNRHSNETIDFYDMSWNKMPFTGLGINSKPGDGISKPLHYDEMKDIATTLAAGTKFVRIDLYNICGKIYFGEFTLYPKSGLGRFNPDEWNTVIGEMIDI